MEKSPLTERDSKLGDCVTMYVCNVIAYNKCYSHDFMREASYAASVNEIIAERKIPIYQREPLYHVMSRPLQLFLHVS